MKEYFKNNPLLILPVVAYTLLHLQQFLTSSYFNFYILGVILLFVSLADFLFFKIQKSYNTFTKYAIAAVYTLFILIFFGLNLTVFFQNIITEICNNYIVRGRILLSIFLLIFASIQFGFSKHKNWFYLQNIFWCNLCLLLLATSINNLANNNKSEPDNFKGKKSENFIGKKSNKPILLLILDEYSSPIQLQNGVNPNSKFLGFSNHLKSDGWVVKNSFESLEISTIHSLASIFNYNLSDNKNFKLVPLFQLAEKYFIKEPYLIDDLNKKNIKVRNFGIFTLGELQPLTRLYFYPTNFLQLFFSYSIFQNLWYNTDGFKIDGLKLSYYPMEIHNKTLLNALPITLNEDRTNNTFIYAHLYMPHSPISFRPNIYREHVNLKNYIDYWHFTNTKVSELIKGIKKTDQIRIIITGDHGFRGDKRINPNDTFAAFWGFEKEDVDKIKTVQDLGSLINAYF